MDHTLTLSDPSAATSRPSVASPAAIADISADEEPESPGRSPSGSQPASSLSDPLSDGLAVLAGMAIALITVLVPLITVVSEPRAIEPARSSVRSQR